jgi:hemoglobin/transferrin/lactoferrin receptor protein
MQAILIRAATLAALAIWFAGPIAATERPGDPIERPAETEEVGSVRSGEEGTAGPEAVADAAVISRPATFLDAVTVTSTRGERPLSGVAGAVSVVDAARIEGELMTDIQDLVRYEPGAYVDGDLTRLGLNGFNIRGIGGNRVLTRIDGIPTGEQFDFGPLSATQSAVDVESLDSVEIVRSAGSSLYGSDALGGVVSLVTKGPGDSLGSERSHWAASGGYDGRDEESHTTLTGALGRERWAGFVTVGLRDGSELGNQGTIGTRDARRTEPNPIDRQELGVLSKLSRSLSDGNELELALERREVESETEVLSARELVDQSFFFPPGSLFLVDTRDVDAIDSHDRTRWSVRQQLVPDGDLPWDSLRWLAYWQDHENEQDVRELRVTTLSVSGSPETVQNEVRDGLLRFEQRSVGGEVQLHKQLGHGVASHLLTYGAAVKADRFDMLRHRVSIDSDTGEVIPQSLALPTKYFPESDVTELGVFLQDEIDLLEGRLRLAPGVRFDSYDLDPEEDDSIFLEGNPGQSPPAAISDSAVSPKLGVVWQAAEALSLVGQYARGFRAPPFSSVNNGFTNQAGGYTTLPNPDLEPETSDNFELGLRLHAGRAAFQLTAFENRYDDFIENVTVGFNPMTGLIEFQYRNLTEVEISGLEMAGDVLLTDAWRLRASFATIEGEETTTQTPLGSIAPAQLVLGVDYSAQSGRWGGALFATAADGKDVEDLASTGGFAAPAYEVLDATVFYRLAARVVLRAGLFNLLDETYWAWPSARGLSGDSPILDRYTSPGRSLSAAVRVHL